MKIHVTKDTYKKFKKAKITDEELKDAVSRAERGLIAAQLGGFLIKQRIPREGQGKSGGFRTIMFYKRGDRVVFLHMFAKNDEENIGNDEQEEYNFFAKKLADLSDETITQLAQKRGWKEIK